MHVSKWIVLNMLPALLVFTSTGCKPEAEPMQPAVTTESSGQDGSPVHESPVAVIPEPAPRDLPQPSPSTQPPAEPAAGATAPVTETFDSLRDKILALRGTIQSFRGRIDVRFDSSYAGAWVKSHTHGTVEYEFKGEKVFYRFDMTVDTHRFGDGEETKTTEKQVMLCDGEYMYQIGEFDGKKAAIKANIDKLQTSVPSEEFFFFLDRDYEVIVMPEDQIQGNAVWVLRAVKKSEDELLRIKTDTYFRQDIPVMVKTVNFDRFDNVMQVTEIRDIEVNVEIDPKRFQFVLTPDMEFEDQSW